MKTHFHLDKNLKWFLKNLSDPVGSGILIHKINIKLCLHSTQMDYTNE